MITKEELEKVRDILGDLIVNEDIDNTIITLTDDMTESFINTVMYIDMCLEFV